MPIMKAAVIGGDEREKEIIRLMKEFGIEVKAIGLPKEIELVLGHPQEEEVADAIKGVSAIICPIPGLGMDDSIYAPSWPNKLYLNLEDLKLAQKNAVLIMGTASPKIKAIAKEAGVVLREYETDDELMILRSAAVAEGAIKIAIENTDITIHRAPVAVLGFGRMSMSIVRLLDAMKARVTLFARNPVQLARGWEMGIEVRHLKELPREIKNFKMIFNTIPVQYLDKEAISLTDPEALLMDLAAPPGGIDFEAAKELNRKAIWARGLGSRAPKTVGQSQWKGISRFLREDLSWDV
jgi:dipicolinate synthase subunit A